LSENFKNRIIDRGSLSSFPDKILIRRVKFAMWQAHNVALRPVVASQRGKIA
jgi:hypothetical protein